eukprot:gene26156-38012_t
MDLSADPAAAVYCGRGARSGAAPLPPQRGWDGGADGKGWHGAAPGGVLSAASLEV